MNRIIIFSVLLVLFFTISTVSAEGNFTSLQDEIDSSIDSIEITQDYKYDKTADYGFKSGISIYSNNFTINGNGHTIDGANQVRIFRIYGENVEISNLNLINANINNIGGAINSMGQITLNNVTFSNNQATSGGAVHTLSSVILNNVTFTNNTAKWGACIYSEQNCTISNSVFSNSNATYAPAIFFSSNLFVKNSIFKDLCASESAGAIGGKRVNNVEINNCSFTNTQANKNGGALFLDVGLPIDYVTNIINSTFFNTCGDFGGAIVQLGGNLCVEDSKLINNHVIYDGGAIYISNVIAKIINTTINENKLSYEDFDCGGGIYSDNSTTIIENCEIMDNSLHGIYAYDTKLTVNNTVFSNNGEAIHGVFTNYELNNNNFGNDTLFLNDTNYISDFFEVGKNIVLINNIINVTLLPSKYDSREWGWVSSVKDQGNMGSCWTFGTCGALESALMKATGIEYSFSENNMQNSMLRYSKYGIQEAVEGGSREQGLEYILSWFGVMPEDYDNYDELGKLSPPYSGAEKIRIMDAIFVKPRNNGTDNNDLKRAILMCGSVTTGYYNNNSALNYKTAAYYQFEENTTNHAISLVGWDDNYPASNFLITPPGDGAFILKNSWGTEFGDNGYMYISYYDTSLLNTSFAIGFIIENTENYTSNYQTDLGGDFEYIFNDGNILYYKNTYEAYANELISAIGTYFDVNENYTFEIYVNDKLVHTQSGIAPYNGYHSVKLTTEIPIAEDDSFTVLMKKTSTILLTKSRQHYLENKSLISTGSEWLDLATVNKTVSLKVYTKELAIYTQDLVKIYKNNSKFEANICEPGKNVTFEINNITYIRLSDEKGSAKININLNPGNYTIKTTYNNVTVENTITVLPTLIGENLVKYYRNDSQFYINLINGEGKSVTGKNITLNINGVFYNRTTNGNGTARLNINLAPGEYIITAIDPLTGLMMSYNITVLPVLTASDFNMTYMDHSQFKARLVDGKGNPLANTALTFNINGVFYKRYTDSNGIAALNIRLMPGVYIITSQYESARISNKITIIAKED